MYKIGQPISFEISLNQRRLLCSMMAGATQDRRIGGITVCVNVVEIVS